MHYSDQRIWNAVAAIVMSELKAVLVSLSEVLEVRGKPLSEPEVWSVLAKAVVAVQDACLHGKYIYELLNVVSLNAFKNLI